MFFDTHTHVHHQIFNQDRKEILMRMRQNQILQFLEIPIDFNSNFVMREKMGDFPDVRYAAGVHPTRTWRMEPDVKSVMRHIRRFARMENTVAIGEIGLDHHIPGTEEYWGIQEEWFHRFIELSKEEHLPMVLHIRQAEEDAIRILREHGSSHKGVVHCFNGSPELAEEYTGMGLLLGIGGCIAMGMEEMENAVKRIPLDFLVLETDCPFLSPDPSMNRNTPMSLPLIAQKIAKIKGISMEEVEHVTTRNALGLFENSCH